MADTNQDVLALRARAFRIHGIPWDVFPTLTPKQLFLIEDEYRREREYRDEVWDSRFASLMHIVYTMHASSKSKKLTAKDFMPQRYQKAKKALTGEELLAKVQHYEVIETQREEREERESQPMPTTHKP